MYINEKSKPIIVTFRTPNGNIWEETHDMKMLNLFKKDITVLEIRDKQTDNILYTKGAK